METIDKLTERQRELLRLLNPLEYGFNQKASAQVMGLSLRQVERIFSQLKKDCPEAMKRFSQLKKDVNYMKRQIKRARPRDPTWFGSDTLRSLGVKEIW